MPFDFMMEYWRRISRWLGRVDDILRLAAMIRMIPANGDDGITERRWVEIDDRGNPISYKITTWGG